MTPVFERQSGQQPMEAPGAPAGKPAYLLVTLDHQRPELGTRGSSPRGWGRGLAAAVWLGLLLAAPPAADADLLELISGAKLEGSVSKIDKQAREVTVVTTMAGRQYTRVYPYSRIHAVTLGDKRYVLTPMPSGGSPAAPRSGSSSAATGGQKVGGQSTGGRTVGGSRPSPRTGSTNVAAIIQQQGATPPDWYETTPLNYPPSLDLTWPEPAPGGWNAQKNIGQYVWDVINPNPSKWKEGTKLMHHLLVVNKDRPEVVLRVMNSLGRFYHNLLQDHARAAFWWQKAGVDKPNNPFPGSASLLAECYYRLGSKPMAAELLTRLEKSSPQFALLKVWADIGETQHALQLAEAYARGNPGVRAIAYMYAADACRMGGDYGKAMEYYQKVLDSPDSGQFAKRIGVEKRRARDSLAAIRLFERADVNRVPDGRYEASSMAYAGPLHVAVQVQGGRIQTIEITRHEEKQFYSALTDTTAKIIQRQSVQGVDATSCATLTSEAIINATAKALASAARP